MTSPAAANPSTSIQLNVPINPSENPNAVLFGSLDLNLVQRLAGALVDRLPASLVVALVGTLGAGKTTLTQGIARAAKIDAAEVTSPTFTLLQTHHGTITLHHLDAYRVADEDEFLELGVDELFEQADSWTLVEWADRISNVLPADALWLQIELTIENDRRDIWATCEDIQISETLKEIADELSQSN